MKIKYLAICFSLCIGALLGYNLNTPALAVLSIVGVIIKEITWKDTELVGIDGYVNATKTTAMPFFVATLWIVWYFASNQNFIQEFFRHYVLR